MRLNIRKITNFDYLLFLCVIILSVIGILFIYSSSVNADGVFISKRKGLPEYIKQIIWVSVGLVLLLSVCLYDYRQIKDRTFLFYLFGLALLVYTSFFGKITNSSRSWIGGDRFSIQPSEFMKIFFILFLAYYLDISKNEEPLKRFIKASAIMFVPFVLILIQPDLGTASVFIPILLIMCFAACIPIRFILFVFLTGVMTIILTLMPMWESDILKKTSVMSAILGTPSISMIVFFSLSISMIVALMGYVFFRHKYYYWFAYILCIAALSFSSALLGRKMLKPYQMMRLIIFLDPEVDTLHHGWNIIQSITAIGSGGAFGMGFLKGSQSHYKYLPEQSTDFIFSILSEEWGFAGGMLVFSLYTLIFIRFLISFKRCDDFFCKMVIAGILGMFFFHFIVNTGMVMGIMPITGIPLLFLSYGGSSLWTAMIATGIIISINLRQIN